MVAMETRQTFNVSGVMAFRFQCAKEWRRAEVILNRTRGVD